MSFRFLAESGTYDSDPTYLSVPGPASATQFTVEVEAAAVLTGVAPVSLARVAGDQIGQLCGETVPGLAFLATIGSELRLPHRQSTVVLAGQARHVCVVASI